MGVCGGYGCERRGKQGKIKKAPCGPTKWGPQGAVVFLLTVVVLGLYILRYRIDYIYSGSSSTLNATL